MRGTFSPLWLLALPTAMMIGGWVTVEYGQTISVIERGVWFALKGADMLLVVTGFLIGLVVGRLKTKR